MTLPLDVSTAQISAAARRRRRSRWAGSSRRDRSTRSRTLVLPRGAPADPRRQRRARRRRAGPPARGRRAPRLPGRDHAEGQGRVPRGPPARARRARPRRPPRRRGATSTAASTSCSRSAPASATSPPTASRRALQARARSIHVDIDARQIGKSYAPTHAIVASAAELPRRRSPTGSRAAHAPPHDRALHRRRRSATRCRRRRKPDRIASHDAIAEIQAIAAAEHDLHGRLRRALPVRRPLPRDQPPRLVHRDDRPRLDGPVDRRRDRRAARAPRSLGRRDLRRRLLRDERVRDRDRGRRAAADPRVRVQRRAARHGRERPRERLRPPPRRTRPSRSTSARSRAASAPRRCAIDRAGQLRTVRDILRDTRGPVVIDVRIDPDITIPKLDRVLAMMPPVGPMKPPVKVIG